MPELSGRQPNSGRKTWQALPSATVGLRHYSPNRNNPFAQIALIPVPPRINYWDDKLLSAKGYGDFNALPSQCREVAGARRSACCSSSTDEIGEWLGAAVLLTIAVLITMAPFLLL